LVEPAEADCAVRCVLCGTVGPVRKTAEAARKALLVLGALRIAVPAGIWEAISAWPCYQGFSDSLMEASVTPNAAPASR
jgi:hypothetical protein